MFATAHQIDAAAQFVDDFALLAEEVARGELHAAVDAKEMGAIDLLTGALVTLITAARLSRLRGCGGYAG